MLPNVIREFNDIYPNARFNIYSTSNVEMLEKLRNNELDFIIMQYPIFINDSSFKEEILCKLNTCFFANKSYYELYLNNHNSITELPIILPMRGFPDINRLEETLKNNNILLKHNFTSYTTELTKELVLEGVGIGWGIKKCIEKEIKDGLLYELPMEFKTPTTVFSIAYNSDFLNKTTKMFIEFFKEKMKEMSN